MKKMMILMMLAMSFSVMAGPGHKGHDDYNLTDEQKTAWKALKEEKHEQMSAAKKDIYADYEDRLSAILDDEQMAKYKEMKAHKKEHMAMKKHKKMKHKKRNNER
ncbi:hypothetical protein [Marinicella rhabdoformis]|uniref:hypothetical protein n=1 Tax=Marinicella rhabdoformis TaxID=2580566 RepID=UPI0012AED09B|nr:hypothetical protein [Marinicella rhabdoformis]